MNRKVEKPNTEPINVPININMNLELYCRFRLLFSICLLLNSISFEFSIISPF